MNAPHDTAHAILAESHSSAEVGAEHKIIAPIHSRTADGHVLKNVHHVESINSGVDSRVIACFYSWQVAREVRRDFNLLSSKIYKRLRSDSSKKIVREMLLEMRMQGQLLQGEAERFPRMQLASPKEVELRITSPLSALLYRVFCEADMSIAILTEASKAGIIMQSNQESIIAPYLMAYSEVKNYLMGSSLNSNMTASQLGKKIGIT